MWLHVHFICWLTKLRAVYLTSIKGNRRDIKFESWHRVHAGEKRPQQAPESFLLESDLAFSTTLQCEEKRERKKKTCFGSVNVTGEGKERKGKKQNEFAHRNELARRK